VRAPMRASLSRIDEILRDKEVWIAKKLVEIKARADLAARDYVSGELFKFLGRNYPLAIEEAPVKRVAAAGFYGGCLAIKAPAGLSGDVRRARIQESLRKFYRPRANSVLKKMVAGSAAQMGLSPDIVRIKELKRSWGICTGNNISLSWRLIMAPAPLIEYVVVHELCHLRHKNHQAEFYALLASHLPDYKERRRELRRLAPALYV